MQKKVLKMPIVKSGNPNDDFIYDYEDTGCEISDKCVMCPLPMCKHDDRNWFVRYKLYAKKRDALHLLKNRNLPYNVIAKQTGGTPTNMRELEKKLENKSIDLDIVDLFYEALYK